MKIHYIIAYIALGIAFAAVSTWILISGKKSARAIKAKFRIGGLMLTISSLLSFVSCSKPETDPILTCYDPVVTSQVSFSNPREGYEVSAGDVIIITINDNFYQNYYYAIIGYDEENEQSLVLQSGELGKGNNTYQITLEETDYRGGIDIAIMGKDGEEKYPIIVKSFILL